MGAKEWRYYYSKAHPEQGHRQIRSEQTSISTGTVIKMACNYEIFERFIYRRELIFLLSEMHLLFKKRNNGTDWELDRDLAPASASGWLCWPGRRMAIPTYTQRGGRAQSPRDGALLHSANPGTNSTHREIHGWQQCLAGLEKDGLNFMQLQIIPQGQDIAFLIASSARPPPPQKGEEGRQKQANRRPFAWQAWGGPAHHSCKRSNGKPSNTRAEPKVQWVAQPSPALWPGEHTLSGSAGRVGALPALWAGREKAEVLVPPPRGKHVFVIYGQPTFRAKE